MFNPLQLKRPTGTNVLGSNIGHPDFYQQRGIAGELPQDYTAPGSGLAALSPDAAMGYDYFNADANYPLFQSYAHGNFFKQGKTLPGTNISNIGELNQELFGSPYDKDIKPFTREAFDAVAKPWVQDAARDWEVRDVSRSNQSTLWDNFGGLAGLAGVSAILAPAVIAGSGGLGALGKLNPVTSIKNSISKASNFLSDPVSAIKGSFSGATPTTAAANPLGLQASQLYNPAALGGKVSSGVTGLAGGAYTPGAGFIAPGGLGIQANTLAAGIPNLANPVWAAPKWAGTQSLPGGGFINPSALNVGPTDLYNPVSLGGTKPGLFDRAKDFLSDQIDPLDALDFIQGDQQQQGAGPTDTAFDGGVGAGSMPMSMMPQPQAQRSQDLDPVIDAIMNTSADQAGAAAIPEYGSQKLQPGTGARQPGYQTDPFASAVQQPRNALAA